MSGLFRFSANIDLANTAHLRDIQVLKTYGAAPYAAALKRLEKQIKEKQTSVNEKIGPSPILSIRLISS